MVRPRIYTDDTVVFLHCQGGSRIQKASDRRRIIDIIIDEGGRTTMGRIDELYGADVRDRVIALLRVGWLAVEE